MLTSRTRILSCLLLAAWLLSACNFPGGPAGVQPTAMSVDAVYTAAAQTLAVQLTLSAPTGAPPDEATAQPPTDTAAPPTALPAVSDTPTTTLPPTNTPIPPAPVTPTVTASENTNCRAGPSRSYDPPIGVLKKGQTAAVHGRNSSGDWWYIENPSKPGSYCWVWDQTTAVIGDIFQLPVITPPPLPPTRTATATASIDWTAAFVKIRSCGDATAIFSINNSGPELESLTLKIVDLTTSTTVFGPNSSDAPFMATSNECPPGGDVLPTDRTYYVGGSVGSANSGDKMRATIKLCTLDGLGGTCSTEEIDFTMP